MAKPSRLISEWFEYDKIVPHTEFTIGTLVLSFPDEIGGEEVVNGARITVRIPSRPAASMLETQQAIYERAILVLKEALSACDGKSAAELRQDATSKPVD